MASRQRFGLDLQGSKDAIFNIGVKPSLTPPPFLQPPQPKPQQPQSPPGLKLQTPPGLRLQAPPGLKPPQLQSPQANRPPPVLFPPSNHDQQLPSKLGKPSSTISEDSDGLIIPSINESGMSAFMDNIKQEGNLMADCELDMFSLGLFQPHPEPANPNILTYDRPVLAIAVGYFNHALQQSLSQPKSLRDRAMSADFRWVVNTDIAQECNDIKIQPRNVNKIYLQFHDMTATKNVQTILRQYGTVDKVIEAVLVGLLPNVDHLKKYKEFGQANTPSKLAEICREFQGLLGISNVSTTESGVTACVGKGTFSVALKGGKYEVKLRPESQSTYLKVLPGGKKEEKNYSSQEVCKEGTIRRIS